MANSIRIGGYQLGMLGVTVTVPGAAADMSWWAPTWSALGRGRSKAGAASWPLCREPCGCSSVGGNGAVIVAGDFNSTTDMLGFRRLLKNGYHDAAEQSGAGLNPTFPANSAVPPLVGIDHILVRNASAGEVRTLRIPGSDHLGLAATVRVPG